MKKSFGDRSFIVAAPTLWNVLPVRGSGWGLVFSVICLFFKYLSVKTCKILMFSFIKKFTVKC